MIAGIDAWITTTGIQSALASGGLDLELDWNTPTNTICWINQYITTSRAPSPGWANFGDLAGCPPVGACDNTWNYNYVSQADYDEELEVPEIYNTAGANASQWVAYAADDYAYCNQTCLHLSPFGYKHAFFGVFTQSGACLQKGGCSGTNNTPAQAMAQMQSTMDPSKMIFFPGPTSTDIIWQI